MRMSNIHIVSLGAGLAERSGWVTVAQEAWEQQPLSPSQGPAHNPFQQRALMVHEVLAMAFTHLCPFLFLPFFSSSTRKK